MAAPTSFETTIEQFPHSVSLDKDSEVEFRIAAKGDRAALLKFGKSLEEQDLLFLRVDISKAPAVDNWLKNVASGLTLSILAYSGDEVVGYATVDRNPARWTRRIGELRVNVAASHRRLGLGRRLTGSIFDIARKLGLRKLMAHMTVDQLGAQAAFKRLGFQPEALLADYVEDRNGRAHDLIIMSFDVDGFSDTLAAPVKL